MARFNYKAATQSFLQWKLPKSFDRYIIDTQTAENYATKECLDKHATHEMALQNNDLHALSKSWTHIAEQTLAHSAIDVEGKAVKVRPGHLGRAKESHFTTQPAAMPIIPRPRDGDHQPISEQGSVELRRWGKQLHRLQSLVRQYNSYNQTHNILAFGQLQTLWISILNAKGFDNKFQQWILDHHEMFVPLQLPQSNIALSLKIHLHNGIPPRNIPFGYRELNSNNLRLLSTYPMEVNLLSNNSVTKLIHPSMPSIFREKPP